MPTISDFKNGETVCLIYDKTKRFIVENNVIINGEIQLLYFNELMGKMATASIEPQYLMVASKQD